MRTFIAIELPKEIKAYLGRLQERLRTTQADVKWVEPDNIHLTLKFLGEIDDVKLEKITAIIEAVAKEKPQFEIRIVSVGAFPKVHFPRVIWVGIDAGDKETKDIAKMLEEKIQKLGIPKEERAFSSHITIGRTRSTKNRDVLIQELKKLGENPLGVDLRFFATKITLYKSTLTPQGPLYEALKETTLTTI